MKVATVILPLQTGGGTTTTTQPPSDVGGMLLRIVGSGANFSPFSPVIGVFTAIFGLILGASAIGGVVSYGEGALRFSWSRGNERKLAVASSQFMHGTKVLVGIASVTTLVGILVTVITAFG
jgi:hypothetical protein